MEWYAHIFENPFYEFAIILLLAAMLGLLGQFLKQPLIVIFIGLGILVGPSVFNIVRSFENIQLLAEIGIAVLLFIVGLKLDLRLIKSTGKVALMTGLGQVLFTSLIGYFIGLALGFSSLHSFYIAVALTFSSTIIIVKLLSDKKEIDSLHGQIAIGFLIVQDIVVILVMIVLSAMNKHGESEFGLATDILKTFLSGLGLVAITVLMMKFIIPRMSYYLAKSQELLTLFAIAWAITLASVSELIGFSAEVGAFMAGVSLASSQFKDVISSRLNSLRDFLLLFFFVNLGSNLNLGLIGSQLPSAMVFSFFVLIGNPIIVLVIMGLMGYRKRTSFLAGLTVAQISEFSLIFASLGLSVGHLNEEIVGLITVVGLVTIGLSTYLILYSHQIYEVIAPALSIFEKQNPFKGLADDYNQKKNYDIIIFGLGRFGGRLADKLNQYGHNRYLGVDFDPQVVEQWQKEGKNVIYGDVEDPEILEQIPFQQASCIVCTVQFAEHALALVKTLQENNYTGNIYLMLATERSNEVLKDLKGVEILFPYEMAATNFYNNFIPRLVNK
jgi:Kef-type K+ transport system membrane component KefB